MSTNQILTNNNQESSPATRIHLDSFLPSIIRNLAEGISVRLFKSYADFQLTITEWRILLQLAEHHSLHAKQIVENTAMEKSKISRALSHLENKGIVKRDIDDKDNRRQQLSLTDYGLEIYTSIAPKALDWERSLLAELDINEYRDLVFLLRKLSSRLKSMDETNTPKKN